MAGERRIANEPPELLGYDKRQGRWKPPEEYFWWSYPPFFEDEEPPLDQSRFWYMIQTS